MSDLFLFLLLLSLGGLIVGLISPGLAIRWGSRKTRGRVFLTYGLAVVVFFILFGVTAPPPVEQPAEKVVEPKVEEPLPLPPTVNLQADAIREKDTVLISGTTDLPDGTYLIYIVRRDYGAGLWPLDAYEVEGELLVRSGKFDTTITDVPEGKLEVQVLFQTLLIQEKRQPDEIIKRFGEMGEKLTGSNVIERGALKRVEVKIIIEPEKTAEEIYEEEYKKWLTGQFSAWDGAHHDLVRLVKEHMNDPDSFKHVETKFLRLQTQEQIDMVGHGAEIDDVYLYMKFRGNNAFGAMVLSEVEALVDKSAATITITSDGF